MGQPVIITLTVRASDLYNAIPQPINQTQLDFAAKKTTAIPLAYAGFVLITAIFPEKSIDIKPSAK